ncbi:hypothetical protein [Neisseria bacilliformis]|nr:hypothetical protein [Neisseria bacilliformis]
MRAALIAARRNLNIILRMWQMPSEKRMVFFRRPLGLDGWGC